MISESPNALEDVNEALKGFLQTTKQSLHFAHFTLDNLGYYSSRTFQKGHWSKNMDTATVSKFVEHVCMERTTEVSQDPILSLILEACGAIHHFMHIVFSASFFLTESEAWQMISAGHAFLSCYTAVAKKAFDGGYCLFALKPVLHLFAHIVFGALQQFKASSGCVINPIAESTFMAENLVGRISRLSRRVSAKKHGTKIFYRYMVACQFHMSNPDGLLDI